MKGVEIVCVVRNRAKRKRMTMTLMILLSFILGFFPSGGGKISAEELNTALTDETVISLKEMESDEKFLDWELSLNKSGASLDAGEIKLELGQGILLDQIISKSEGISTVDKVAGNEYQILTAAITGEQKVAFRTAFTDETTTDFMVTASIIVHGTTYKVTATAAVPSRVTIVEPVEAKVEALGAVAETPAETKIEIPLEPMVPETPAANAEKVELLANIIWVGIPEGQTSPETTINLHDGSGILERKVLPKGESRVVFAPVDKLDAQGNEITYTVTQDALKDYETVISVNNGFEITNTYVTQQVPVPDEDPTYTNEQTFISWSPVPSLMQSRTLALVLASDLNQAAAVLASMTDSEGTYPDPYTQVGNNIRNPKNLSDPGNPVRFEYPEGWLTKYASDSTNPGEFNINLKIEGKAKTTIETTDIVIVLDNSNSMAQNNRLAGANTAATSFIKGLLDPDGNNLYDPLSPIKIALVTFGSNLVPANSYYTLTYNGNNLIPKLPTAAESGGTFTQMALVQASAILGTSTATNKIVLVLSDGVPTYSYRVTAVVPNTGTYNLVDYQDVASFPPTVKATTFNSTIIGSGQYYTIQSPYSVGGYTVPNNGFATMSQALLMKPNYKIYGVGIELADGGGFGTATLNDALNVMKNISTDDNYYYNASQASDLTNILKAIASTVTKTIANGSVTDPMGTMINLNRGTDAIFNSSDYTLTGSSAGVLSGVVVSETPPGTIKITGLNLGAGEWVNLQYKVNLRTEDPAFIPDYYYETNGHTFLTPLSTDPGTTRDFMVPAVKAPGTIISGNKTWVNDLAEDRPANITLSLYRTSSDEVKTKVGPSLVVAADQIVDNVWPYSFPKVPIFDNHGHTYTYTVEEAALDGYTTLIAGFGITNTLKTGTLQVKKVGDDGTTAITAGFATFELRQGVTVIIAQQTVSGLTTFQNIRLGVYQLVETVAPAGYELDPTIYTVIVQLNTTTHNIEVIVKTGGVSGTVVPSVPLVVKDKKLGSIEILKEDSVTFAPLKDAKFDLYREVASGTPGAVAFSMLDGTTIYGIKINVAPLVTGSNGKTPAVGNLVQGSYFVVETEAPTTPIAYDLLTEPVRILLNSPNLTVTTTIVNTKSALIPMTGGVGNMVFSFIGIGLMIGALFGFKKYNSNGKNKGKGVNIMKGKRLFTLIFTLLMLFVFAAPTIAKAAVHTTDVVIHKLELTKPAGPVANDGSEKTIATLATDLGLLTTDIKVLPGVVFTYWKITDNANLTALNAMALVPGALDTAYGAGVPLAATDVNGQIMVNLPDGKYYFRETFTPPEVEKQIAVPFLMELPQMKLDGLSYFGTGVNALHLYPKNVRVLGAVELKKLDGTTPLAGAKFKLYKGVPTIPFDPANPSAGGTEYIPEGETLPPVYTTDANGRIVINGLPYGDYFFVETLAPGTYLLNQHPVIFKIVNDGVADAGGVATSGVVVRPTLQNYKAPEVDKYITAHGTTSDSVGFNENATWIVEVNLPEDIATYSKLMVTDLLDPRLNFTGLVSVTAEPGAVALVNPTNYTFAPPPPAYGGPLMFNFNPSTLAGKTKITITFTTKINELAVMGQAIPNKATITFNNGSNNDHNEDSNVANVYTGGKKFMKVIENEAGAGLAGAKFVVKNGAGKYLQFTSPNDYAWVTNIAQATEITSGADGTFEIKGLKYDVTVPQGTEYFLVETYAPAPYNLVLDPVSFYVNGTSYWTDPVVASVAAAPDKIINKAGPTIPQTGGIGTLVFSIIGFGLMGSAVVLNKRKQKV